MLRFDIVSIAFLLLRYPLKATDHVRAAWHLLLGASSLHCHCLELWKQGLHLGYLHRFAATRLPEEVASGANDQIDVLIILRIMRLLLRAPLLCWTLHPGLHRLRIVRGGCSSLEVAFAAGASLRRTGSVLFLQLSQGQLGHYFGVRH